MEEAAEIEAQNQYLWDTYVKLNVGSIDRKLYQQMNIARYKQKPLLPLVQQAFPSASAHSEAAAPAESHLLAVSAVAGLPFEVSRAACIASEDNFDDENSLICVGDHGGSLRKFDPEGVLLGVITPKPNRGITAVAVLGDDWVLVGRFNSTVQLFHGNGQVGAEVRLKGGRPFLLQSKSERVAAVSPSGCAIFSWSSAGLVLIREEKFEAKITAAAVYDAPGGLCVLVPAEYSSTGHHEVRTDDEDRVDGLVGSLMVYSEEQTQPYQIDDLIETRTWDPAHGWRVVYHDSVPRVSQLCVAEYNNVLAIVSDTNESSYLSLYSLNSAQTGKLDKLKSATPMGMSQEQGASITCIASHLSSFIIGNSRGIVNQYACDGTLLNSWDVCSKLASGVSSLAMRPPLGVLAGCTDDRCLTLLIPSPSSVEEWSVETHQAFPVWLKKLAVAMLISEQTLGPRMLEMLMLAALEISCGGGRLTTKASKRLALIQRYENYRGH